MSETEVNSLNYPRGEWGAREWDVFDSDGRFLGVVTLPHLFSPKLFRGEKIYGIGRDELEVQYVVGLRIVGDLGVGATWCGFRAFVLESRSFIGRGVGTVLWDVGRLASKAHLPEGGGGVNGSGSALQDEPIDGLRKPDG
jgi:hypothetical protein